MNELKELNEVVRYLETQLEVIKQLVIESLEDNEKYMYFQGKKSAIEETLYKINKIMIN
jgi:hypothetical protein